MRKLQAVQGSKNTMLQAAPCVHLVQKLPCTQPYAPGALWCSLPPLGASPLHRQPHDHQMPEGLLHCRCSQADHLVCPQTSSHAAVGGGPAAALTAGAHPEGEYVKMHKHRQSMERGKVGRINES